MKKTCKIKKVDKVTYDNTFNKTGLSLLTRVQSGVLMAVLSKMGESRDEEGRFVADFHFRDLRQMTDMNGLYSSRLQRILSELINTKVEFFDDDETYYQGNLFSNYYLTKSNEVRITLSTDMTKKMMIDENQYTVLDLAEYLDIKNKYSKELYRTLRQFRYTGMLAIKKSDLLNFMNPPKSYDEYEFIRRGLNIALEENKKYFDNLKLLDFDGKSIPEICIFTFKKHKKHKMKDIDGKVITDEEKELLKYIEEHGGQ